MIIPYKRDNLIQTKELTVERKANSELNRKEMYENVLNPISKPQRLILELTNLCNINCVMCGRNAASFTPTMFDFNWFNKFEPIMSQIEEVTLMGWGEPTMHPDFKKMLAYLHKHGVRKYFCTNGMKLDELQQAIFDYEVDVFAVSLDGADAETNARIRRGMDFEKLKKSLKSIIAYKNANKLHYPHINFVMALMKSNIKQLPDLVDLAAEWGLEEVKAVYLTVFQPELLGESLWDCRALVEEVFAEAAERAEKLGILLKLPELQGDSAAGEAEHTPCFAPWRDFFCGSDGYVRACMHIADKLFHIDKYETFEQMWQSSEYIDWRMQVNNSESMNLGCKKCYFSTFANWNKRHAFIQVGNNFSPKWEIK